LHKLANTAVGINYNTLSKQKEYSRDLLVSRQDRVDEKVFAKATKSLDLPLDDALFARWVANFLL
jgi:hypothetical protein